MRNCSLVWSAKALSDLQRLHTFLLEKSAIAAVSSSEKIVQSISKLATFPRLGELMPEFKQAEIRRIYVVQYEIRYSITRLDNSDATVTILRIWHTREQRH